ncbi:hypothetical protein DVH05_014189 [Phytophthora capsici]|nr:hypothetical protein DVH05_014189 [Phytophthora capsici]
MSFDVRTSLVNDKCPSRCWEQRKWRAKKLVEKYQPDLIGTQEGAPDQIDFFTSNMSYASLGECAGECKWNERNSIFYKTGALGGAGEHDVRSGKSFLNLNVLSDQ